MSDQYGDHLWGIEKKVKHLLNKAIPLLDQLTEGKLLHFVQPW